ncbi:putative alanine transaminase [Lentithecium fluviatile CBS 122367]|uniref:Alanine aminotransferase 1 n=1 Tax=Lentithecium fluviatile CBS 122367 TaxID=1168545 RepID=A0A6G1IDM8_9PLEO|nr:putative alanine transaminase [Lentithecium fluviatile CBS 122367]
MSTQLTASGPITLKTINPGILRADYAVRGKLAALAAQIRVDLGNGTHKWPFNRIVSLNLGNPQGCGQKPLTFFRQVLALLEYPELLELAEAGELGDAFPQDTRTRASALLRAVGSIGAYSSNYGYQCVREAVAEYISKRDGFPSVPEDIFLTCGAFEGMLISMTLLSGGHMQQPGERVGVLLPVPFYPVYRALLITLDLVPIFYHLDEQEGWKVRGKSSLENVIADARNQGIVPRCIVVINPSNPTGTVSSQANLETIIELSAEQNLVLLADEVYQENLFPGYTFVSCKAALRRVQTTRSSQDTRYSSLQLISLHSVSKGMVGEGGQRGGYFEAIGFPSEVREQLQKLITYMLQPASAGQILVDLMVNPPAPGQESYPLYKQEHTAVYNRLQRQADALDKAFEQMPGVHCARAQGAIYHFPRVGLPPAAVRAAKEMGETPDVWYCKKLLEATGVCVVPGSGFGMSDGSEDGKIWFRISFLDDETGWIGAMDRFQRQLLERYAGK